MSFTRRKENFVCAHCGAHVEGNGYTNHCPKCLWSKHVDVEPGDRMAACGGMMEPVALEGSTPAYRIVHRCVRCGMVRRVGVSPHDEVGALLAIPARHATMPSMNADTNTPEDLEDEEEKTDADDTAALDIAGINPLAAEESVEEDDRGNDSGS